MNSDRKVDYYVGLDMGTGALGCAVTDTQYRLIKVKGKDFWFVCLNTSNHSFPLSLAKPSIFVYTIKQKIGLVGL